MPAHICEIVTYSVAGGVAGWCLYDLWLRGAARREAMVSGERLMKWD
jgi:hypothetical protein